MKRYVTRFKIVEGKLFKRSFQGRWMICIPTKETNGVLSKLHEGEPAGHPGGKGYGKWLYTRDTTGL